MPPTQPINLIMYGGALVVIIFLVFLLMRGDFVTGREHKAAVDIRDRRIEKLEAEVVLWQDLTIKNSDIADKVVDRLPEKDRSGGRARG